MCNMHLLSVYLVPTTPRISQRVYNEGLRRDTRQVVPL